MFGAIAQFEYVLQMKAVVNTNNVELSTMEATWKATHTDVARCLDADILATSGNPEGEIGTTGCWAKYWLSMLTLSSFARYHSVGMSRHLSDRNQAW
jgi:hypothetical protein